ncbi:hypothetical protein Nepgr_014027 [Nepenthes gracilis]|uniref:Uncharacterized protein n=1 Tax=Nepenthes gracilis TaxID=150966 RepID=A0AAD3SK85_NEPGR|nr:hypothetical protein Nepgr_014027 [Nepenthes gracilis]
MEVLGDMLEALVNQGFHSYRDPVAQLESSVRLSPINVRNVGLVDIQCFGRGECQTLSGPCHRSVIRDAIP